MDLNLIRYSKNVIIFNFLKYNINIIFNVIYITYEFEIYINYAIF